MLRRVFAWLPAVLLAALPCVSFAQETTGGIEGALMDSTGSLLGGAKVVATSPSLQGERSAGSDEGGYFRLPGLPIGHYTLSVTKLGHEPLVLTDIPVRLGSTTSLGKLILRVRAIDMPVVEVAWKRPVLDLTSSTARHVISASASDRLPLDRQFSSVAVLLPQANVSYLGDGLNVGGTTGPENTYYVDGVNITDFSGTTIDAPRIPSNFVREVDVREAGYAAEYGRGLGGGINAVTHSGGNRLHGAAFGFFSNSTLTGRARQVIAGTETPESADYDAGLSLGGPLVADRIWFYAAYNPSVSTRRIAIPGLDPQEARSTKHSFAGKITWKALPMTSVAFTVGGDPTSSHTVNLTDFWGLTPTTITTLDPFLLHHTSGWTYGSLSAKHAATARLVLDATFSGVGRTRLTEGETEAGRTQPQFIDHTTGEVSGGSGQHYRYEDRAWTGTVHATWSAGPHLVKAGLGYEQTSVNSTELFVSPGIIEKFSDTTYTALWFEGRYETTNRVPGGFVQDSWRVNPWLRVDAGLRLDQQMLYFGARKVQSFRAEWQPRFGVIVQPRRDGRDKLYGSYGRFYQQLSPYVTPSVADNWTDYFREDPRNAGVTPVSRDVYILSTSPLIPMPARPEGEGFDEVTVGYERVLDRTDLKVAVRGMLRNQVSAYLGGFDYTTGFAVGNPGEAPIDYLPHVKRQYRSLELSVEREAPAGLSLMASYVWSRNWGNYGGLFAAEQGRYVAGNNFALQLPEQAVNSTGWLPNDRTHVVKAALSYVFRLGLAAGAFASWQTGTPLTEMGASALGYGRPVYLSQRGTAGRLADLWDLNLRLAYSIRPIQSRVVLDVLHAGNPQRAVNADQWRYLAVDENGQQTLENPNYARATAFQPPQSVRLGWETRW